jgi:hypothetical protein
MANPTRHAPPVQSKTKDHTHTWITYRRGLCFYTHSCHSSEWEVLLWLPAAVDFGSFSLGGPLLASATEKQAKSNSATGVFCLPYSRTVEARRTIDRLHIIHYSLLTKSSFCELRSLVGVREPPSKQKGPAAAQ